MSVGCLLSKTPRSYRHAEEEEVEEEEEEEEECLFTLTPCLVVNHRRHLALHHTAPGDGDGDGHDVAAGCDAQTTSRERRHLELGPGRM